MSLLKSRCENDLKDTIEKLRVKLNDPNLTEKQYKAIEGVYFRKIQALKEGRIY